MPYGFTVEDFNKFSEDILKAEGDQATLTTLLADMSGTFTEAVAKDIAATERVEAVSAENERLKTANMELFIRVGSNAISKDEKSGKSDTDEKLPETTSDYMRNYFNSLDASEK